MHYSKLKISKDATSKLRTLKQRTHVTPNILCRYALMRSLDDGAVGTTASPDQDGQEFNAYTLTGELTELFLTLVRFVEEEASGATLEPEEILNRTRGHIHRGIGMMAVRVRSIADLADLSRSA